MTTLPLLTPVQRDEALRKANTIRIANAATYREIGELSRSEGRRAVAAILRRPTGPQAAMRIGMLLRSIRFVSVVRATKLLDRAGIVDPNRRVAATGKAHGALTERQRLALAYILEVVR